MKKDRLYQVAVIGLGYVGLPLAKLFLEKGHIVYGIDLDENKVHKLNNRQSYLNDLTDQDIQAMFSTNRFYVGKKYNVIEYADVVVLCVPTPLTDEGHPNLTFIEKAMQTALPFLRKKQLIVLESTTFPGTTEEVLFPMVESAGFKVGKDISLAYSPERIDPGQKQFNLDQIPKVVSGVTQSCTDDVRNVYETVFQHVVVVSSTKIAEMSKILENCQRYVNISLMNELVMLCDRMGINLWEVISAANTKPYGFTPYYPGPGVGGHCIPIDPMFLLWKAKKYNVDLQFIRIASHINQSIPTFVAKKVDRSLQTIGKSTKESRILVIGITYKKDVNDLRESPAPLIMRLLTASGAKVNFYDPYVEKLEHGEMSLDRIELTAENIKRHDCTLILTDHSSIPYALLADHSRLIIDTRYAMGHLKGKGNIVFL